MPILTPLRAVATSAVALVVAATGGVVLAETPPTPTVAVPAVVEADGLAQHATDLRDAPITSRSAAREALAASALTAVQEREASLAATDSLIDATEKAEAERAAAEQAAAEKAAAEAAKPKGGTRAQNKELGRQLALDLYGWGADQFTCYDNIIMRESLWDQHADNPTSSAYGIPQALPGKRMASEGADWKTNPATQITWGLKYVKDRYGTPCKAWSFKRAKGWY